MLTRDRLIEKFRYEPETGLFRHASDVRVGNGGALLVAKKGEVAGYVNDRGYVCISIDGREYRAHRLAWLYQTGELLSNSIQIDHINGVRSDNRWGNLRTASNSENSQNERRARVNNKSGFLGVSRHRSGAFRARIVIDGAEISLGLHATPEAAHDAYVEAKRALHPFSTI